MSGQSIETESPTPVDPGPAAPGGRDRPRRAVVHVREFLADSVTPLSLYRRLLKISPVRFLFESISGGEQVSRFSFLGAGPSVLYRVYEDRLEMEIGDRRQALEGTALEALRRVLGSVVSEPGPVPFTGGFVGFFGYDMIRLVERLPDRPSDAFELPIAILGRFDTLVVFDHAQQRVLAIANEIEGEVSVADAERSLAELSRLLTSPAGTRALAMPSADDSGSEDGESEDGGVRAADPSTWGPPSIDGATYREAVRQAKEYIAAGDIFQVVLARRWRLPSSPEPLALFRALRMVNPSPYMSLLELPDVTLVGTSPEMLVKKHGLRLETRPIAGTRPRGVDPEGDQHLEEDLKADPKERAEHVMLVDLGRNDLGRVGAAGTVRVDEFMEIERYSHVMHLVSSVIADLDGHHDALDALLACFPAGTVSGAPKIRAMEIIDELEPESRGPYAGACGYFSFSGDVDTCITIRTLVVKDGETSITAGAGIVADSDPAAEERETENKAAGMLAAVELARRLEAQG